MAMRADPDYWFNFGYSLWKQGEFALAAEKFRAVLDRSPTDQEATIMLGRCIKMDGPRAGRPAQRRTGTHQDCFRGFRLPATTGRTENQTH